MGRIYLVRHGEVEFNRANAYIGSTDLPLNEIGRQQAHLLADYLANKNISSVYSSNLSRAVETAQVLAKRLGVPINLIPELRELNYGEWEGVPESEVESRFSNLYHMYLENPLKVRIPGGEKVQDLIDRAWPAFLQVAEKCIHSNALIVAHKCINRVLICLILGIDPNNYRLIGQGNAAVNVIEVRQDGRIIIEKVNDTCHVKSNFPPKESLEPTLNS
ncbi:MAG: histidine phosphatase family protein [Armatimonadota bacterium]|nr:histidine phosphatase family protein [Armatimonadota bacterium]